MNCHHLALIATVTLWGSSFPGIKIVMAHVDPLTYTWLRGLLSTIILLPIIAHYGFGNKTCVLGGLFAGVFYSMGLFFQGWGTAYTTASNSAFITGLNTLFVHLIRAVTRKKYPLRLGLSLAAGLTGLFLLTSPSGEARIGDLLVLVGAIMWAMQILAVDKYSGCNPFILVFYMFIPTLLFFPWGRPSVITLVLTDARILLILFYLAAFCSIGAFTLQAYGQRRVSPEATAIIFLLEPVLAAFFSAILLGESLSSTQLLGASLIVSSMYFSINVPGNPGQDHP